MVETPPDGDTWLHEIKLDGYRILARCENGKARLFTRRGNDWSSRIPTLVDAISRIPARRAWLDGEVVVLSEGVSDFQRLQNSLAEGRDNDCLYYVFDLLYADGHDLRDWPLRKRKVLLANLVTALPKTEAKRIRYSDHVIGRGHEFFQRACQLGAEGNVSKNADAPYSPGRNRHWLKSKCLARQEFVIGGFSDPQGSRGHFGSLLLGVYANGDLTYAGRVGTGFTARSLAELHQKMLPLVRDTPPFWNAPKGAEVRDAHWIEPTLVAEIQFSERTKDGLVRHAVFQGLREDKPASEVRPEYPAETSKKRASSPRRGSLKRSPLLPALRSVRLTHPDRVLYKEQGITKADLALYYAQVAERMLPHVRRRPLMLVRCPEGESQECFHQKHPGRGVSPTIRRIALEEKKGLFEYMYVEDAAGLIELVQVGALEVHAWGCHIDDVERPDQLTFDLDPDEGLPWPRLVEAAREVKDRLEDLGLSTFLKTTGGKGLHIVTPLRPSADWEVAKRFCKSVAEMLVRYAPDKYLSSISKAKRKGKILIDYLRNGRGATAVCPYSTRARTGAPVSMPILWKELTPQLRSTAFYIGNTPDRIASIPDPWADFERARTPLTSSILGKLGI